MSRRATHVVALLAEGNRRAADRQDVTTRADACID
jgi:hypothetical protein